MSTITGALEAAAEREAISGQLEATQTQLVQAQASANEAEQLAAARLSELTRHGACKQKPNSGRPSRIAG